MLFTSAIKAMGGGILASLPKMAVKVRAVVELGKTKMITQKVNLRSWHLYHVVLWKISSKRCAQLVYSSEEVRQYLKVYFMPSLQSSGLHIWDLQQYKIVCQNAECNSPTAQIILQCQVVYIAGNHLTNTCLNFNPLQLPKVKCHCKNRLRGQQKNVFAW